MSNGWEGEEGCIACLRQAGKKARSKAVAHFVRKDGIGSGVKLACGKQAAATKGVRSGDGGAQFQCGFPAGSFFAGEFAATGDAGELIAELQFTESLERSAGVERGARP